MVEDAGNGEQAAARAEAEQEQQEQQEEGGPAEDPMLADEQPTEQQAHVADEAHEPDQEQHDLQASDADAVPDSALADVHGPHDPDMDLPLHLRQPLAGAASSPSHPNHQEQQQDGAVLNPATHQDAADPMAVEGAEAEEGATGQEPMEEGRAEEEAEGELEGEGMVEAAAADPSDAEVECREGEEAGHAEYADEVQEGEEGGVEGEQAMEAEGGGGEWQGNGLLNTEEVDDKGDGEGEEQDGHRLVEAANVIAKRAAAAAAVAAAVVAEAAAVLEHPCRPPPDNLSVVI
ncbi:hypothetical protein V8C86DRAFT_342251 [Haematococcus lacustris]